MKQQSIFEAHTCKQLIELQFYPDLGICGGVPVKIKRGTGLKCPLCGQTVWRSKGKTALENWNEKNRKVK